MIFINSRIVAASNGQYTGRADHNIAELKHIMKSLTIRERPATTQANFEPSQSKANFATDQPPTSWAKKKEASTQTGGRMWAGLPSKRTKQVKTFAL